jgi:beta-phosphoglucomutase-like phosphatase (HAD superfamily)
MPGITDYLREARQLGLKLGVASSSTHEWVDSHLKRLGLLDYFDAVKCREDVAYTKPDPALYLAALDASGLRSEQALAIEDSPNGITAAQRAGIFCVAVPNPVTAQLALDHADFHLTSLTDMSLKQLLAVVQERREGVGEAL